MIFGRESYFEYFRFIICSIFLLSGCEADNEQQQYEKDLAVIRKFLQSSGDAVTKGDIEAEVNRFTADGIYMWPDTPSIAGQNELRNWFKKRFLKVKVELENLTEEIDLCGDLAFERGKYIAQIKLKENNKIYLVKGKYINILRKQPDGSWKISRRIRNQDHK
jgi:ketosteroid isomerase-like protein